MIPLPSPAPGEGRGRGPLRSNGRVRGEGLLAGLRERALAVVELAFESIAEAEPGPKWQALFHRLWPGYEAWFFAEGDEARAPYLSSRRALRQAMPALIPVYDRLCELAGGGDRAARFLSLYCPPPYLTGCSQVIWPGDEPILIRNYDYAPRLCEGLMLATCWTGRRVIAMSDCSWGVLDGMNEDGLAVSLTFGGRRIVGEGFGMPLLLRAVLESCATVEEGAALLERVPTHMAYNVTLLDRSGAHLTLFLSPDRPAERHTKLVATNHQGRVEWHRYATFTRSVERERYLEMRLMRRDETPVPLIAEFLRPPLYSTTYEAGFGTIYTAIYYPARGLVELRWPQASWRQSFAEFREEWRVIRFPSSPGPRARPTHPPIS
jgi:predicted choloylglycine hydrolase